MYRLWPFFLLHGEALAMERLLWQASAFDYSPTLP